MTVTPVFSNFSKTGNANLRGIHRSRAHQKSSTGNPQATGLRKLQADIDIYSGGGGPEVEASWYDDRYVQSKEEEEKDDDDDLTGINEEDPFLEEDPNSRWVKAVIRYTVTLQSGTEGDVEEAMQFLTTGPQIRVVEEYMLGTRDGENKETAYTENIRYTEFMELFSDKLGKEGCSFENIDEETISFSAVSKMHIKRIGDDDDKDELNPAEDVIGRLEQWLDKETGGHGSIYMIVGFFMLLPFLYSVCKLCLIRRSAKVRDDPLAEWRNASRNMGNDMAWIRQNFDNSDGRNNRSRAERFHRQG